MDKQLKEHLYQELNEVLQQLEDRDLRGAKMSVEVLIEEIQLL
jgi:hypothetical protein